MSNQKEFNRADGGGYEFLIDTVLALDPKNPQVAARLLSALKSWRVLEPGRRALAQSALRKVAAQPSLSRDVSDIAGRALAENLSVFAPAAAPPRAGSNRSGAGAKATLNQGGSGRAAVS